MRSHLKVTFLFQCLHWLVLFEILKGSQNQKTWKIFLLLTVFYTPLSNIFMQNLSGFLVKIQFASWLSLGGVALDLFPWTEEGARIGKTSSSGQNAVTVSSGLSRWSCISPEKDMPRQSGKRQQQTTSSGSKARRTMPWRS